MSGLLILYTGGTIGMAMGPDGLAPAPGLLEQAVAGLAPQGTQFEAFDPLVDSADIGPVAWNHIIARAETWAGPVVVIHGTDTMSFTGAALAAALSRRAWPVVLCGAMKPLGMAGDAQSNLAQAIATAAQAGPGVWLAFAGKVLAAAGLVKQDSQRLDAFVSVPQAAIPAPAIARFGAKRLTVLSLTPGLPAAALAAVLAQLDGAVLRVFGTGTMMNDVEIQKVMADFVATGKRLRAVSQCTTGGVQMAAYAAGAGLWAAGVEDGGTETPELALMRLWLDLPA